MGSRLFTAALFAAAGCTPPLTQAGEPLLVVQRSPLAGFRHYEARRVWPDLSVGDRLDLVREADNPYDGNAVRVEWRGHKLGYVPRRENAAVARHLDRGTVLNARVAELRENRNHSVRLEFEVVAPLGPEPPVARSSSVDSRP